MGVKLLNNTVQDTDSYLQGDYSATRLPGVFYSFT
jgi:hypothetical protein